jgi:hypothetical protein
MFLGNKKDQKIVIKMIRKRHPNPLDFDTFIIEYMGTLLFLYVDTYGIPKRTAKEWIFGLKD